MRVPPGLGAHPINEGQPLTRWVLLRLPCELEGGSVVLPTNDEEESALQGRHSHF